MARSELRDHRIPLYPAGSRLTVRRQIAAPAEELFDAWLDPASFAAWMFSGELLRKAEVNPVVGGKFEVSANNAARATYCGRYLAIERPYRLVFSWISLGMRHADALVTVEFRALRQDRTELVVTQVRLRDELSKASSVRPRARSAARG